MHWLIAIVEHRADMAHVAVDELLARKLSGLETLIDISYFIAADDIGDESARAGLNLLESIGRTGGLQASVTGQMGQNLRPDWRTSDRRGRRRQRT